MSSDLATTRVEDGILYVTLNRAEKRNALTIEMTHAIAQAVKSADDHPEVRAVIVGAEGPVFSAGIDVQGLAMAKAQAAEIHPGRWLRRLADELQYDLHLIESTEAPVIGALHGFVIGMGLELAMSFDLRVCDPDCKFSIPESRMGLVADVGGTTRLTKTIGPSRAKDMLMTARQVDAQEALSWGLVNRVAEPGGAMNGAVALAKQIMKNAPLAVGMAKLIVDHGDGLDKHSQMAIERWAQSQLVTTDDFGEAIASFLEKRDPDFKAK